MHRMLYAAQRQTIPKKHMKGKHNIFPDVLTFSCSQCSANENNLLLLRKHSITNHQKPRVKICYSCRIGFQSKTDYANNVNKDYGLLIYDMAPEDINSVKPTVTSINGSISYYMITPESTVWTLWSTFSQNARKFQTL